MEVPVPGKFELFKDASGGYRWNLKASNGETVASSESYSSRSGAVAGTEAVKRAAADATVVDRD